MRDWQSVVMGLKRRYFRREFDMRCRTVLTTPPVELDESCGLVVLSQSYHKDLLMYLVAAKSFARYVRPSRFVVVDDGYTSEDQDLIRAHLRRVEFIPRKSVSSAACPVGGCWERLLSIAELNADHYVIQLDSDTVTMADPTEVRECVARNASFTLSTKQGRDFLSVEDAARAMEGSESQHIQVLAEQALGRVPQLAGTWYIRGCAGFAGFARGSLDRPSIERFSALMSEAVGSQAWRRWGSEQFASNYLIANAPVRGLLPFEFYPYWQVGMGVGGAKFIHFIGDDRFTSSMYREMALKAIG